MEKLKLFSREQVGNAPLTGRQYSRPDSLSLVSRQSVLAFLLVLLTTVFGVGNAWGEDEIFYTLEPVASNASGSSAYATAIDLDINEITWNVKGNTSLTPWRIGGKNLTESDLSLFSKTKMGANITKIEITHNGASSVTVHSMKVEVASDADFNTIISTLTPEFEASGTVTVDRPNGKDWTDCFYRITYNVTIGGSNKFIAFEKAKFYKEKEAVTSPTIEADVDEIAFGTKNVYETANQSGSLNIAVEGVNLTGNITAALSGDDAAKFSISGAPFVPTDGSASGTLVVSYEVSEAGDYEALVTLSSDGATNVELPISLSAVNIAPKVYEKVLSDSELSAGDKIVIINEQYKKAAGAISGTLLSVIDITAALDASNGKLSITDEAVQVFTLGGEEGAWTLTSEAGQLSSTEAKKVTANGTTTWAITISSGDAAPVSSTSAAGTLQYNDNNGNGRFTTYTSSQKPVQFYKESDGKAAAGLAYAEADKSNLVKVGASFTAPTLTNPNSLTVAYTSSDDNVVAVDANSGALTIKAAGKAEITASFTGDDDYKAGSATYAIFVAEQAGTADDPLTEASAKALIDLGCTLSAHVTGTVTGSQNTTDFTVTLSGGFQFYKLKDLGEVAFESAYVSAGDEVTAYGKLDKYYSTYQLANGCYLTSYTASTISKTSIANDQATAYTVAQALVYAADAVTYDLDDEVYVRGKVAVASTDLFSNKYLTYSISDDGTNENVLKVYNGLGVNGADFTSIDDIKVGEIVIVKGKLYDFKGTKELTDNELVWKKPVATIAIDNMALEFEEEKTISATITPDAAVSTVSYSIKEGSDDCITLAAGKVTAKSVAGTATIIATIDATDDYEGATKEFTVTVAAPDTRKVANSAASGFTATSGNLEPADIAFESFRGGNSNNDPIVYNNTKGIRLYQRSGTNAYGNFVTLTAAHGYKIDQVVITTTNSFESTTVAYSVDGNETLSESESVSASGTYSTPTGLNVESINILNTGTGSSGRLEIASIKVYYTGEAATIDHYELGGTYTTEFETGDEFNHEGLIVYAAYDAQGDDKEDITAACTFSEPDMSVAGEKTIEITYKEAVVKSYTINVTEATPDTRKVANSPATFTATSGDLTPADIKYEAFKGTSSTNPAIYNDGIRLYQDGGYITISAVKGCKIDEVQVTSTGTYDCSSVVYTVNDDETELGDAAVVKESTYKTAKGLNADNVNIICKGTSKTDRLEIASIKVYYTGEALDVDHYILGGTYATEFEQYGEFNFEGLTVTAAYDELETITEAVTGFTVEADLSTAGNKKAEVMLNSVKIAEYDITVTASTKEDPALAYDPTSVILTKGDALSAPTFSNTYGVAVSYESDNEAVATVDAEGNIALAGGCGTAVITASFAGDDDYIASEATFTITVNEPAEDLSGTWVLASSVAAGDRIIIADVAAAGVVYTMGEQANNGTGNNRVAVESAVDEYGVLTPAAGTKTFLVVDVENGEFALQALNGNYLYAASNSSNHLKETSDINNVNAKWTITIENGVATIKALHEGHASRNWMRKNESSAIFSCYGSGQEDIVIYKHGTPDYGSYQRDVTNGNYGTICLPKAGTISGATLFEIADYDGSMIYVDEILSGEMEAGKPYIFQATSEQLNVVYTSGTIVDEAGHANGLYGFYNLTNENAQYDIPVDAGNYILYQDAYWLVSGRAAYIANYRAYIVLDDITPKAAAPGRRRVAMAVHGEQTATGMDALNATDAPVKMMINGQLFILRGEKMYDATGRLVK